MKWYLASRTVHTEKMKHIAEFLKSQNREITSGWIYIDEKLKPFTQHLERVREIAIENVKGMLESDILLKFNDLGGTDLFSEFGVFLGRAAAGEKVKIYLIGDFDETTILQHHPVVKHVKNLQEVLEAEKINYDGFVFPEIC